MTIHAGKRLEVGCSRAVRNVVFGLVAGLAVALLPAAEPEGASAPAKKPSAAMRPTRASQTPLPQRGGQSPLPLPAIQPIAKARNGHGLLCRVGPKTILIVSGTPEEMGTAHGTLLREQAQRLTERVLYGVGGAESLYSGTWFIDKMAEIQRRTTPHIPRRFIEECDALSAAAGVSTRDGRYANLFPERFHCSGVAVRGAATVGGRVLHARVLDYMRDIHLQSAAAVQVFLPDGYNRWMSLGYAGFIGTVTAMNEKGLAVGEMGGRGEGQWDGMPMSFLLRDVMERASNVEEALEILRKTPRTCEYYYVLSDKSRNIAAVAATPERLEVLRPGQQHQRLPKVPEDTVLMSAGQRAEMLSRRIHEHYGRIDVRTLIDIIRRPVAMNSNLHNAVFCAETLDMWFADAGRATPACDEPYAHVNLGELIRTYQRLIGPNESARRE
jgi:isopenicillin-N N-acyltransferase like protein